MRESFVLVHALFALLSTIFRAFSRSSTIFLAIFRVGPPIRAPSGSLASHTPKEFSSVCAASSDVLLPFRVVSVFRGFSVFYFRVHWWFFSLRTSHVGLRPYLRFSSWRGQKASEFASFSSIFLQPKKINAHFPVPQIANIKSKIL